MMQKSIFDRAPLFEVPYIITENEIRIKYGHKLTFETKEQAVERLYDRCIRKYNHVFLGKDERSRLLEIKLQDKRMTIYGFNLRSMINNMFEGKEDEELLDALEEYIKKMVIANKAELEAKKKKEEVCM